MSKYGYIGAVPTQADGSNSGVFSITEINKLINAGQWSTLIDIGNINLIYEYNISGSETYIDFLSSDISPTTYKDYFLVVNYVGTSVGQLYIDFSTNNCSSFTSNTYEYNSSRGTSNSTTQTGDVESGQTYMQKLTYDTTGEVGAMIQIANLYATETTMVNCVSTANNGSDVYRNTIYGGEVNSSSSEQYNSFRVGLSSGSFSSGNISVYTYVAS